MTKRAKGEGSIGRRGDGNGWQARYSYVEGGIVRRRSLYGRTRDEVTAKLPKTVQLAHTVLHPALAQALRWRKVGRNVTDLVDPPRVPRTEAATLTPMQLSTLRGAARTHRLEALFVLAMLTGMRRGELLALRCGAFDLDARVVEVRGTLQRVPGGAVVAEPKSAASRRSIALGDDAIAALRAHRARQAQERLLAANLWEGGENAFVFTNETGRPVAPNSVAARRLGHSSAGITLDRYSHVTDDLERAAAAAVEAVLRQAGEAVPEARAT